MRTDYFKVYASLRYRWEPGREVRERLQNEHDIKMSGPEFYQAISYLRGIELADFRYVEVVVGRTEIKQPQVKKLPWGQKAEEKLGKQVGLEGLVLSPA